MGSTKKLYHSHSCGSAIKFTSFLNQDFSSIFRISRLSKNCSLWHTQRAQENQFCKVLYLGNKIALGLNASKLYFFWSPFQIAVDGRYEKICICLVLQALCICVFVNGSSLPLVATGKDCSNVHFRIS